MAVSHGPLAGSAPLAGRVLVETEEGLQSRLVNLDRDLCMIPNVAIHMNRKANDGYTYNPAVDLIPLVGSLETKGAFRKLVAEAPAAGRRRSWDPTCSSITGRRPEFGERKGSISPPGLWTICNAHGPPWRASSRHRREKASRCAVSLTTKRWAPTPSRGRIPPS